MKYPLTIGMATHQDYDGVFFTVNALRFYHDVRDCELVIVDNSPNTEHGRHVRGMVQDGSVVNGVLQGTMPGWGSIKYVPIPDVVGTSVPRDRIFREATGEAVLAIDCHVLLADGAIDRLKEFYRRHSHTQDLYSGPLIFDNYFGPLANAEIKEFAAGGIATHMTPRWRGEMEGTWSHAWRCRCGRTIDVFDEPEQTTTVYRALLSEGPAQAEYRCKCGMLAPACEWGGHEQKLLEKGWQPCAMTADDKPIEIPGQGLGLFTCRREAWLGFHPHARGFGGEEIYVHRKFTQAGRKNWCLPFLGWYHRFARPEGVRYNLERYSKARNYVLEYQELGLDTAPIKEQLVGEGRLKESEWAHLLNDPLKNETAPQCSTCGGGQAMARGEGDIAQKDWDRFVELVKQHERVAIVSKRNWFRDVAVEGGARQIKFFPADGSVPEIQECDLLIIHSRHHADALGRELEALAPKTTSRILLRSTGAFGENAEGGGPGLLPAMRRYLRQHPEWHVIEHSQENWGYTILSRAPEDRKELPGILTMAKNFASAMADHVADGLDKTSSAGMELRLNKCSVCPLRVDDRCSACGCFIAAKAAMRSAECPIGEWPEDEGDAP